MTRLLVSVRSATEAHAALAGGAHLIDVKEPAAGPLGAAPSQVWRAVHEAVAGRTPLSVALGELRDQLGPSNAWPVELRLANFAKLGLAGFARRAWRDALTAAIGCFPAHVQPVFVAYADYKEADSPPPEELIAFAAEHARCAAVLLDTYVKNGRDLLQHCPRERLAKLIGDIHAARRLAVVGGGLSQYNIRQITLLKPDYIAVRSAVCAGERTAAVDRNKVAQVAALL